MLLMLAFRLSIIFGLAFAPIAMASACAHHTGSSAHGQHASPSHAAANGGDQREPIKSTRCSGNCAAVEAGILSLSAPFLSRLSLETIADVSPLRHILLDLDTPPPR